MDPDTVHLHEVGAVDAVLDIVGAIEGFERLGVESVYNLPVAIGDGWVGDLEQIEALNEHVDDSAFLEDFALAKRKNKETLARDIQQRLGIVVSPDAMFDVQIKRIHEYKRQLLNALQIVARYQAILANPDPAFKKCDF